MTGATRALHAVLVLGLDDGAGAVLIEPGTSPRSGRLDAALLPADPLTALDLAAPAGVLAPNADARARRAEARAACALEAALSSPSMQEVLHRLIALRGAARVQDVPFVLLIDARTPHCARIPWELLEALRPSESAPDGLQVVRMAPAGVTIPRASQPSLEVLAWTPSPGDAVCAAARDRLSTAIAPLEAVSVRHLVELSEADLAPPEDAARALHVICHGEPRLEQLVFRAGPSGHATESVTRRLEGLLPGVSAVLLEVCGGASEVLAMLDAPAGRFVAAGAPVCVGPRLPWSAEASGAFVSGFYGTLSDGGTVLAAATVGRRRLAALPVAHPHWRWWNPAVVVGDAAQIDHRPVLPPSRIDGWPVAAAPVQPVLRRALELAAVSGFLGLEQMALALCEQPALRAAVGAGDAGLDAMQDALQRYEPRGPVVTAPRLRQLGGFLEPGFALRALAELVFASLPVRGWMGDAMMARAGVLADGGDTLVTGTMGTTAAGQAALALGELPADCAELVMEVLGGPEDGRFVALEVGHVLGRADGDANDVGLLGGTLPTARRLSRTHLRVSDDAVIEAHRGIRICRRGVPLAGGGDLAPGEQVALQVGDRLLLGKTVLLLVRALPG